MPSNFLLSPFKIKGVKFKNRIVLAPMAGVTDASFRKLALKWGAGFTYSEMISDHAFHYQNNKTKKMLINFTNKYTGFQIFGSDIGYIVQLAKHLDSLDFVKIIDINMGCPVPKIAQKSKAGSYWLRSSEKVYELVSTIVKNVKKPVSVKIRIGIDDTNLNGIEIAKQIERAGASIICVHGRTKNQGYSGVANLDYIRKIKQAVQIPVICNGDLRDAKAIENALKITGCDLYMIGRASMGNPFIFSEIKASLLKKNFSLSQKTLIKTMTNHYRLLVKEHGSKLASLKMKSHFLWYLKKYYYPIDIKQDYLANGDFYKAINKLKQIKLIKK